MGKKARSGKGDPPDLETLLKRTLSEYLQVNTVPSGKLNRGPYLESSTGHETIKLRPLCHYQRGCPQNLCEFMESMMTTSGVFPPVTEKKANAATLFAWWARSQLRFSCSTLAVVLVRCFIRQLQAMGIEEVPSLSLSGRSVIIRLEDLEVMTLCFIPKKIHDVVLSYPLFSGRGTESVEMLSGIPPLCNYNPLRCRRSGIIVDIALGQFFGTMQQYIFPNTDEYLAAIPEESSSLK